MTAAGLRAVPWLRPSKDSPRGLFNCADCLAGTSVETRAGMHCGYMPRSKWRPGNAGVPRIGGDDPCDVCPAWLARQQAVVDGCEAGMALEAGALAAYDPIGLNIVWEAASAAAAAQNHHTVVTSERTP